ncbi:hypothetical protein HMI54_012303 [Coelomomyces lativittatus]|nr:hypothetical protein HMI54_012303 [Coelomomyces lativittatus]KAJ1499243.1 hypothetical protein HMI55_004510 [Coelomomyces lativittatus]
MPSLDSDHQETNRNKLSMEEFYLNLQRLVHFMNSFEHAINAKLTVTNSKLFQLQRELNFLEERISITTQTETTKMNLSARTKQNEEEVSSPK